MKEIKELMLAVEVCVKSFGLRAVAKGKELWNKFGILTLTAGAGVIPSEYISNPDVAVALKVAGMISLFLLIASLALDDREGKGLFPHYDEDALIKKCGDSPIASALVIATKNFLLAVILILAVLFVRP